jgi:hypothetical protein
MRPVLQHQRGRFRLFRPRRTGGYVCRHHSRVLTPRPVFRLGALIGNQRNPSTFETIEEGADPSDPRREPSDPARVSPPECRRKRATQLPPSGVSPAPCWEAQVSELGEAWLVASSRASLFRNGLKEDHVWLSRGAERLPAQSPPAGAADQVRRIARGRDGDQLLVVCRTMRGNSPL